MAAATPLRVLAIFRHPTPYRDPLLDRVAALPGLLLRALYLAETFPNTPWKRGRLEHEHSFPTCWLRIPIGRPATTHLGFHPEVGWELLVRQPDVVVMGSYSDPTSWMVCLLCRLLRIPLIQCSESLRRGGAVPGTQHAHGFFVPWLVRSARAWLPAGSRARAHLATLGADPERSHRFPTSPDTRGFSATIARLREERDPREELPGELDDEHVVFVGRFVTEKAVDVLLDAWPKVLERRPKARLLLVGDGPLREQVEAQAATTSRVELLGFREFGEVAAIMAGSDVFVLPSRFEPWGSVACEALAAGLPVVLSEEVGSATDVLAEPDPPGVLVPIEDPMALADALVTVLADPQRGSEPQRERSRRRAWAWGHDRNLQSLLRALTDCGFDVREAERAADLPALD
ncbi:MAG: glycosyltransferase family 4 protein [Acidobacteriota bacterium]